MFAKPRRGITCLAPALLFCSLALAEPTPVQSRPFSELAIYPRHSAPATVVSEHHSRISAEVSARIVALPVQVGDRVEKGDLLARLDETDFVLQLQRAQATLDAVNARLDLAQYELKRARSLSKKQAVSAQLLKQRESERDALLAEQQAGQAAVRQARRQRDKCTITAPFSGVIVERSGQLGELARPGSPLLRLVDTDNLELTARLSAAQAADLQDSLSATNAVPRFVSAGRDYPVSLRTITPLLDTQARTREARLVFSGPKPLPGSAGQLVWSSPRASLPAELLSRRDDTLGVFIQTGNRARFVPLPQAQAGRPAAVELAPDSLVITQGRYRLHDGDAIAPPGAATGQ